MKKLGNYAAFVVPLAGFPHTRPDVEAYGMTATKRFSILITDDDAGCREALRDIFEAEGYRTLMAASGEEAVDIVKEKPVHVALLDMHLPRLTGLETLQLVRQVNTVMPCILVTADNDETLMRQAFRARVYSVIPKPVSRNVVLYTVVQAIIKVYGELLRPAEEGLAKPNPPPPPKV